MPKPKRTAEERARQKEADDIVTRMYALDAAVYTEREEVLAAISDLGYLQRLLADTARSLEADGILDRRGYYESAALEVLEELFGKLWVLSESHF